MFVDVCTGDFRVEGGIGFTDLLDLVDIRLWIVRGHIRVSPLGLALHRTTSQLLHRSTLGLLLRDEHPFNLSTCLSEQVAMRLHLLFILKKIVL